MEENTVNINLPACFESEKQKILTIHIAFETCLCLTVLLD